MRARPFVKYVVVSSTLYSKMRGCWRTRSATPSSEQCIMRHGIVRPSSCKTNAYVYYKTCIMRHRIVRPSSYKKQVYLEQNYKTCIMRHNIQAVQCVFTAYQKGKKTSLYSARTDSLVNKVGQGRIDTPYMNCTTGFPCLPTALCIHCTYMVLAIYNPIRRRRWEKLNDCKLKCIARHGSRLHSVNDRHG